MPSPLKDCGRDAEDLARVCARNCNHERTKDEKLYHIWKTGGIIAPAGFVQSGKSCEPAPDPIDILIEFFDFEIWTVAVLPVVCLHCRPYCCLFGFRERKISRRMEART
jgi:hypothetical protein